MMCPRCARAKMEVVSRTEIPMWRYVLAGIVILVGIVMYIGHDLVDSSNGVGLAGVLHSGYMVCLVVSGLLIWLGDYTILRCPVCGYSSRVGSRRLDRIERDERYRELRRGATRSERIGMWLERNTSWASEVGPTTSEQGRQPRSWYGRYAVLFVVVVIIAIALVMAGAALFAIGA